MMEQTMKREQKLWSCAVAGLIVLLAVVGSFSLYRINQLHTEQQQAMYQTEAMYQRSLGELTDAVQNLNGQLAQLLVTTSQEQLLLGLSNLWREVYSAISYLGSLPVAMHELEQTDLLLNDIAEYSYYLLRKNVLQQNPLTLQDWNQLEEFYHRSQVVKQELDILETSLLADAFRLTAISLEDEANPVVTTFRSIETQVDAFPELTFDEGVRKIEPEPRPIQGEPTDENQAITNADNFLAALDLSDEQGTLAFVTEHTKVPVYGIAYPGNQYVEVSQVGGHVLQYYLSRELGAAALKLSEAEQKATALLQQLHFTDLVCVERTLEQNTANFIFVPEQDGVYLYPDMIKLQLALDNGALLSFDQTSYQTRHYTRTLAAPTLREEEILQNRNPNFQLESVHLALITDSYSIHELLTYEIRGTIVGEAFSIFVDAHTGQEVRIVQRTDTIN